MNILKDQVCTACTLMCDDVDFQISGNTIATSTTCARLEQWVASANLKLSQSGIGPSLTTKDFNAICQAIANRLAQAVSPVITGLNHLTTQQQQSAWRLADIVGATIDVSLDTSGRAGQFSLEQQGKVTASLGEVINRGDLIVFWYCDPLVSHPRLLERLKAKTGKKIIVIDQTQTATASAADLFFEIPGCDAAELLHQIRSGLRMQKLSVSDGEKESETKPSSLSTHATVANSVQQLLIDCRYGTLIYGHIESDSNFDATTLAHQSLVRELNDHTRFVSLGLRNDQNAQSAENVMAAFGGYSAAQQLGRQLPQYNGLEYSARQSVLAGECDCLMLFAGAATRQEFQRDPELAQAIKHVPTIVITSDCDADYFSSLDAVETVHVGQPGLTIAGEWCRFDDVSLPVGQLIDGEGLVSATDLLNSLIKMVTA